MPVFDRDQNCYGEIIAILFYVSFAIRYIEEQSESFSEYEKRKKKAARYSIFMPVLSTDVTSILPHIHGRRTTLYF